MHLRKLPKAHCTRNAPTKSCSQFESEVYSRRGFQKGKAAEVINMSILYHESESPARVRETLSAGS